MNQDSILHLNAWSDMWANAMWRACWQGALCILGVWALCRLVPRLPASARCGLWWLACAKLLLTLVWVTPVKLALLPATPTAQTSSSQNGSAASHTTPLIPVPHSPEGFAFRVVRSRPFGISARSVSMAGPSPASFGLVLWLMAVAIRVVVLVLQWRRVRRWVANAEPVRLPEVDRLARKVAAALGLFRMPRVMVSSEVTDPLVTGIFRPTVLLSASDIRNLSAEELQLVLAHEFTHLKRGDLWLGWCPLLAQTLFCFHPFAWLACYEFDLSREEACDAEAIQSSQIAFSTYGRLLLKLGAKPEAAGMAGALGVVSGFKSLRRRIAMLEHISQMSLRRRFATLVGLCSLMVVIALIPWKMVAAQTRLASLKNRGTGSASSESTVFPTPRNLSFANGLEGWSKTANGDNQTPNPFYKVGIDPDVTRNGIACAYLMNSVKRPEGYGALRQDLGAEGYRGKRVHLSVYLKTEAITDYTAPFLALTGEKLLSYAMVKHPIKGTTDWTKYEYVVDVPQNTVGMMLGVSIKGKGKVWASDFHLDVVGKEVPLTQSKPDIERASSEELPDHPLNIDFSSGLAGWGNDNPEHNAQEGYTIGLDKTEPFHGKDSAYLASIVDHPKSYGTLMQNFLPKAYRGKRLRMSASLKTDAVEKYAGLWIVMQSPTAGGADWHTHMALKGTTFWEPVAYVVHVPKDANFFSFGLALEGRGKVWIRDLKFEVVGPDVPLTPPTDSDGGTSYPGNTPRVLALWQLGRMGKYPELLKAAQAVVDASDATPEERVTALDSLAYAYVALKNYPEAKKTLDRFDQERKGLNIDPGVIAEAKRLRADEPGNIGK